VILVQIEAAGRRESGAGTRRLSDKGAVLQHGKPFIGTWQVDKDVFVFVGCGFRRQRSQVGTGVLEPCQTGNREYRQPAKSFVCAAIGTSLSASNISICV
jgi:hypothetical protein